MNDPSLSSIVKSEVPTCGVKAEETLDGNSDCNLWGDTFAMQSLRNTKEAFPLIDTSLPAAEIVPTIRHEISPETISTSTRRPSSFSQEFRDSLLEEILERRCHHCGNLLVENANLYRENLRARQRARQLQRREAKAGHSAVAEV